jgi:hypothetical protein
VAGEGLSVFQSAPVAAVEVRVADGVGIGDAGLNARLLGWVEADEILTGDLDNCGLPAALAVVAGGSARL